MRWMLLAFPLTLAAGAGLGADAPLRPEHMRQAMGLKLGAWQTKTRLVDVKVEPVAGGSAGDGAGAEAALRAQFGKGATEGLCLWDDPDRLYLPGIIAMPGCDYSRIEARNGRFAVTATCRNPEPAGVIEVAVEGTYTPERMTTRSEMTATVLGMRARIKLESASRFKGKCDSIPVVMSPQLKS
jgi:hypothetical protein